jgi:serine/threonine-protein kinase
MFERALEAAADNYLAWGNLGDAHYWAPGQRDRSTAAYRRALELGAERLAVNPSDGLLASYMARYHAMLGEPEAARRLLQQAMTNAPANNDVIHSAAQIEAQLSNTEAAIAHLRDAVEGGYPLAEIEVDPIFAELRQHPDFPAAADG